MKQISIRFLIGLHCKTDAPDIQASLVIDRRISAQAYLAKRYHFGAMYQGTGYWQGTSEPCVMWETIVTDNVRERDIARSVARELASMLGQECVGLVFTPVEFQTVKPD